MTRAYVKDEADVSLLKDIIFDRKYWDKLDAGTITDEAVVSDIKTRIPERLYELAEKVYYGWIYNIPTVNGMEEIVIKLKEKGINLCILSNISKYFVQHYTEVPVLKHFDKFVFSSTCAKVKPNTDIFEYALAKYGFTGNETLFVDDRLDNVQGAEKTGITGYVFDGDAQKLNDYLIKNGII
jgi:putative hydrolase of the HAD superfamily